MIVDPVHPFECGELHFFEVALWRSLMDEHGFVKAVDHFDETILTGNARLPTDNAAHESIAHEGMQTKPVRSRHM